MGDEVSARHYMGFGARVTPCDLFPLLRTVAGELESLGYTLRSGGAKGADLAFESGVTSSAKEISKPDDVISREAFEIAKLHHPAWRNCSGYARRCHARNSLQVLGPELNDPSAFGVCWTPGAREIGGSAQTMRVAKAYGVSVYNFADPKALQGFLQTYLPCRADLATTYARL